MFSGLITQQGRVVGCERLSSGGLILHVQATGLAFHDVTLGDSIAVDGVCLTVTAWQDGVLQFDVVPETIRRSTLARVDLEQMVNLELSLRLGDRLGGHFVYGHVDCCVPLLAKQPEGQGCLLRFARPEHLRIYLVEKGYVALDGVSVTIASVGAEYFEVAIIPETAQRTSLGRKEPEALMNLEIDPIARYAAEHAARYASEPQTSR